MVSGAYPSRTTFPFVPGFDGVARVVAVGDDESSELLGKRVIVVGGPGTWQQQRVVRTRQCVIVPDDLTDDVAAFAYINPLSAVLMLEKVPEEVKIAVITAASSTIGRQLARLLRARNVETIGLSSGRPEQTNVPADDYAMTIDRRDKAWIELMKSALGNRNIDIVFDCVGGDDAAELMALMKPDGLFIHYGLMSQRPIPSSCYLDQSVFNFHLRRCVDSLSSEDLVRYFDIVFNGIRKGLLTTSIAAEFGLHDIVAAARRFEALPGKVLIRGEVEAERLRS